MIEALTVDELEFVPWPKIPRLNREIVVTEKIDGTNAAVVIKNDGTIYAQSRTRVIFPGKEDNAGFAGWVAANSESLSDDLGPGRHFGEWWGSGIQRGYGLPKGEKIFSLFNVLKWREAEPEFDTHNLRVVPVLYEGLFSQTAIENACDSLRYEGSRVANWPDPEGVVVFHKAGNDLYKVLLQNDQLPKGYADHA